MGTTVHVVDPRDRRRIRCMDCGSPAQVCHHDRRGAGISLWYYCLADAIRRGVALAGGR